MDRRCWSLLFFSKSERDVGSGREGLPHRLTRIAALLLLVAGTTLVGATWHPAHVRAQADDSAAEEEVDEEAIKKAGARFRRGVMLFQRGAYRAALIEFQRAYETAPNYRLLYNIGQTHLELQEHLEAAQAFEKYLIDGGAEIDAVRREEVEQSMRMLKEFVAVIGVKANVDGAVVYIDDKEVGVTPLPRAVSVNLGRHRVSVASHDGRTASKTIDLAAGDVVEVELELEELEAGTAIVVEQKRGPKRRASIALLATAGALGIGTAVVGIMQGSAQSDYERALDARTPGDPQKIDEERDSAKTLALTTDLLGATTIAAAAVGTVLWFLSSDEEMAERPIEANVAVGRRRAGLVARMRF